MKSKVNPGDLGWTTVARFPAGAAYVDVYIDGTIIIESESAVVLEGMTGSGRSTRAKMSVPVHIRMTRAEWKKAVTRVDAAQKMVERKFKRKW